MEAVHQSTTPRARALRCAALALVSLAVAGQGASLLHQALAPHAVCAAHGESYHPSAAGAPEDATADTHLAASAALGADEHDHCFAVPNRREPVVSASATPLPTPPPAAAIRLIPEARAAHAAIATLSLAPKLSPPLA